MLSEEGAILLFVWSIVDGQNMFVMQDCQMDLTCVEDKNQRYISYLNVEQQAMLIGLAA